METSVAAGRDLPGPRAEGRGECHARPIAGARPSACRPDPIRHPPRAPMEPTRNARSPRRLRLPRPHLRRPLPADPRTSPGCRRVARCRPIASRCSSRWASSARWWCSPRAMASTTALHPRCAGAVRRSGARHRAARADAPDAEIARLHAGGMRGVRYMMIGGVLGWESLPGRWPRAGQRGLDGQPAAGRPHHSRARGGAQAAAVPAGARPQRQVPGAGGAQRIPRSSRCLRVLDAERVWIKLSAPYETSKQRRARLRRREPARAHAGRDVSPSGASLASNWPHPGRDPRPTAVPLYDLLFSWAPRRRCSAGSQSATSSAPFSRPAASPGEPVVRTDS